MPVGLRILTRAVRLLTSFRVAGRASDIRSPSGKDEGGDRKGTRQAGQAQPETVVVSHFFDRPFVRPEHPHGQGFGFFRFVSTETVS